MLDTISILVPPGTQLVLDYVNGRLERHPVNAIVQRLRPVRRGERLFVQVDAIDTDAVGQRYKRYLAHRILSIVEPETGEVFDTQPQILARLFRDTGYPAPEAANPHKRVPGTGIEFGADGYAIGWAFGVHQAFWAALDIVEAPLDPYARSPRAMITHGHPRAYAFGPGDMLHAPRTPNDRWDRQLATLSHTVQILDGSTDNIAPDGEIVAGVITYRITHHRSGKVEIRETSQAQFVEMLRTGVLPAATFDLPAEN